MDTLRGTVRRGLRVPRPGPKPTRSDYRGPDEVLGLFARIFEVSGEAYQADLHDAVADDAHTVALFTARGQREGTRLEDRNVLVAHVRNGKLAEVWVFAEDLYTFDAFFS
jgi:ketosteroid isomerase-like protein